MGVIMSFAPFVRLELLYVIIGHNVFEIHVYSTEYVIG